MKMTLMAVVAASALSLTLASHAPAAPADGAAIALIAHQADAAITIATKKKPPKCPEGQEISTRTGKCRAPTSEEK
jgi:uncharacterized low-complexity protein